LAAAAEIELPEQVPAKYAPMTWEQLRTAESRGMSFGPHTVTHPILARATEVESGREIRESWERLRQMAHDPVPVFCYPNGQLADFAERELSVLRELKFAGAVVGTYGHASVADFAKPSGSFKVRRFGLPDDLPHVAQCVSGIERLKELMRGGR
jgi:peptidoglycan/xylan/chitin deacetylase (PgdA/CDA1 family)